MALIEGFKAEVILADKGYDAQFVIEGVTALGAIPVIPPKSNRLTPRDFDRDLI